MKNYSESVNPHKLYKNRENGYVAGVCAGISDYLGVSVAVVRIIVIFGSIFISPLFILGYIILALVLDKKPAVLYRSKEEENFWRTVSFAPRDTYKSLVHKFRTMEGRLRKMEDYVTSGEYELEKKYRDLK